MFYHQQKQVPNAEETPREWQGQTHCTLLYDMAHQLKEFPTILSNSSQGNLSLTVTALSLVHWRLVLIKVNNHKNLHKPIHIDYLVACYLRNCESSNQNIRQEKSWWELKTDRQNNERILWKICTNIIRCK